MSAASHRGECGRAIITSMVRMTIAPADKSIAQSVTAYEAPAGG